MSNENLPELFLGVHKLHAPVFCLKLACILMTFALTIRYQIFYTLHGAFTNMFSIVFMSN